MLKGIDPALGPELLAILRAMGHGDEIVIADSNFPADSHAERLVRADGLSATRLAKAIAAIMPIDDFVPNAAFRMAVTDKPDEVPPIIGEFAGILRDAGYKGSIEPIERFAFYERAKDAYAIIATGEQRIWANLILKKGIVPPGDVWE
ncbi:MAG TPA: RbsD/FucU domain-containing protein [Rhizomicrobium sp.]|jgi:L-fucose mutarotase|nr:RbsD/FucU domain-containing protein [Rhizomicrobium sp.]